MLKKTLIAINIIGIAATSCGVAQANDGTIKFIGQISSSACTVNSVADNSSTTGTVDFGTVSEKTLATAGGANKATPFSITLSDCAVSSAPTITFSGTPVATENYTNLFSSSVAGVGIRIEDADRSGTFYTPGTAATNTGLNSLTAKTVATATANFNAYLVAYTTGTHTGSISTPITFVINYAGS